MNPLFALPIAAVLLSLVMAGAWGVQRRTGQSGWIDAFWSFGTGLAAAFCALWPFTGIGSRQWLVAGLALSWGARLGGHIARRAASAGRDDPRYAYLREQWGSRFPARLFLFLQIQALCGLGLAASAWAAGHAPRAGLDLQDALGTALLFGSILGAGVADGQLTAYAKAHRGGVCAVGLWRWSRHPNYFFEWLGWVAYPVIAIQPGYPLGWLALLGPLLIYALLVHASGIPPLEQHMLRSRGEAFRAYQRRTSAFFPLPPKG